LTYVFEDVAVTAFVALFAQKLNNLGTCWIHQENPVVRILRTGHAVMRHWRVDEWATHS